MNGKLSFIFLFFLLLTHFISAQDSTYYDFGFKRNQQIKVFEDNLQLKLAWTGGLNSVRFSEIDLNFDGKNDLFAFEKHGNRILTFIDNGSFYTFAPEYSRKFPELHDWAILKDFDYDGLPDIFSYSLAGIRVFKNTSFDNTLSFSLIADPLNAFYYNGYVNLYASPDDYLVIDDVDGDGKIDILNFYVLGKYVHFLKNYSSDNQTLDLKLEDECWGKFSEADDNNLITLLSDCNSRSDEPLRHTGSSLLLHDFTKNGLPDLLVGDVDSPHLILLYNNGIQNQALMTQQDTAFPASSPVNLYSMPTASFIQLYDNDFHSLIVSPSDPSFTKSQDLNSVWVYDYDSLLNDYVLIRKDFLQSEMIDVGSGAYPVLFDFDNDGLTDLFIGNYGSFDSASYDNGFLKSHFSSSVSYYKNTGTVNNPEFTLQTNDFGNLKSFNFKGLYPTFGDFTGDGLTDMLCGCSDGNLILIPNVRLLTNTGDIVFNYSDIDVGEFSTPQFFDLDRDGKKDLLIGNRRGLISFYKNVGNQYPEFQKITDTLGGIDSRNMQQSYFGYSVPCFYRDSQGTTYLFCGNECGEVAYYKNIDNNLEGEFDFVEHNLAETIDGQAFKFQEGKRLGVAVCELNGDNYPEIIIGNYAGGVAYFEGAIPPAHNTLCIRQIADYNIFPNPSSGHFNIISENEINMVAVYDLQGRMVCQISNYDKSMSLNLNFLPNGLYFVRINNIFTEKVIINR